MSALTVWGVAAKIGEIAAHYSPMGRLTSAHVVREFDLGLPADPIRVTARHNPNHEIGDLVHIELDADDRLLAVCVLDDADYIADAGDLYFSPDYTAYGRNLRSHTFIVEKAVLTGLAVTPSPAGLAAKAAPLKTMPGDLRDGHARYSSWPSTWRSNALLERAVEQRSKSRAPTAIIGPPPVRVEGGYLVDGELVVTDARYARRARPGGIRYGPPGRVLRVS